MPDGEVSRYCELLTRRLAEVLGEALLGVYALGGVALGDYRPGASDVDVYVVVDAPLPRELRLAVADACRHRVLPCPARKLELVVISAAVAADPGAAPDWELNLNTGAGEVDHVGLDPAAEARHWFVVDLALAHRCGVSLFGPPVHELIASPATAEVRDAQREVVAWYARHGSEPETAAAACRAWHWFDTGAFATKRQAIRWAAQRV